MTRWPGARDRPRGRCPVPVLAILAGACAGEAVRSPGAEEVAVPSCERTGVDSDADGLSDACETALAEAFAPVLLVEAGGCGSGAEARAERGEGAPGGGYFFVVHPTAAGARIGYLPAWFRDCGWRGPKCRLPWVDCAPHAGDSEAIVVEAGAGVGGWRVRGVFLSAHCFGRRAAGCRWYRGPELGAFGWAAHGAARGGPVVWVANGRQANYPSREACDRGHGFLDSCDGDRLRVPFPVDPGRNVGSRARPGALGGSRPGCAPAAAVDPTGAATAAGAEECFWDPDARFRGWQGAGPGAGPGVTAYERYLAEVIGG